jgi:hypothetical protein
VEAVDTGDEEYFSRARAPTRLLTAHFRTLAQLSILAAERLSSVVF